MNYEYVQRVGVDAKVINNLFKLKINPRGIDGDKVKVIGVLGTKELLHRDEAASKYTSIDGRRLNYMRMDRSSVYLVTDGQEISCKVIAIPKGKVVDVNGKGYDNRYMVVGYNDRIVAVKKDLFRKMGYITVTKEELLRNRGEKRKPEQYNDGISLGLGKGNISTAQERVAEMLRGQQTETEEVGTKRTYVIKKRILSTDNKLVGYVMEDNSGKTYNIKEDKALAMAKRKLIENGVYAKQNGHGIIKGYGVRIENLPKLYV